MSCVKHAVAIEVDENYDMATIGSRLRSVQIPQQRAQRFAAWRPDNFGIILIILEYFTIEW